MTTTILFDIDGVLLDSFDANFEFYRRLFTTAGYTPPEKDFYIQQRLFQKTMLGVIQTILAMDDGKEIDRVMAIGKQRGTLYPYAMINAPIHLKEIFKTLHQSYTLGLVTSRIKNGIFEIPQLAAIKQYLSTVVAFEDSVHHKPDPEPLTIAMHELHVSPGEVIYIGDQQADYLAAKAAGVKIIMLSTEQFDHPDAQVTTFDEIPEAIVTIA